MSLTPVRHQVLPMRLVPAASPHLSGQDVLWAQRPDAVYLTIDLKEVQDIKAAFLQSAWTDGARSRSQVNLDSEKMSFYGKAAMCSADVFVC